MEFFTFENEITLKRGQKAAPRWWAMLETVTTRLGADFFKRSSRQFVSRKWPRWFTPNCISNPSSVFHFGQLIIPPSQNIRVLDTSQQLFLERCLKGVSERHAPSDVTHAPTCIIDEHVQPLFTCKHIVGKLSHWLQRRQIQLSDDNIFISAPLPHILCSLISSVHVSARQNDPRA